MTLAIDIAAARIAHIQKGLAITEIIEMEDDGDLVTTPYAESIARVYPYFPDASKVPTDFPCWINQWSAPEVSYRSAVVIGNFSTRMVLLVKDAQTSRGAAIASAFYWQLVQAFAANIKLGGWGPATVLALRGGQPNTLTSDLPYAGFVGLDMQLDYHLNAGLTMQAGSF